MIRWLDPSCLVVREPFCALFPVDECVLSAVSADMRVHGYDASKPIDVWGVGGVVVDGHTRLRAALESGIGRLPVFEHDFASEGEALEYAIRNQRNRRSLSDAEILRCIASLDQRRREGRPETTRDCPETTQGCVVSGPSSQHTAELLGISARKVEQARTVSDYADEDVREAVEAGEMSVNQAYNVTQERRREQEAQGARFNRTNDNIAWAWWSWNPVTGCKHGCAYCYARDIAMRFQGTFEPQFHAERLNAPQNTNLPTLPVDAPEVDKVGSRNVFVCSMADLFGEWVPQEWIDAVLEAARATPQWSFIFLTKNPARLAGIAWPGNAWVGATVDVQARVRATEEAFREVHAAVRFISCEPLREPIRLSSPELFDWYIIGGQSRTSGAPAMQPEWAWVEGLWEQARAVGALVYWKPNLQSRPREYPGAGR